MRVCEISSLRGVDETLCSCAAQDCCSQRVLCGVLMHSAVFVSCVSAVCAVLRVAVAQETLCSLCAQGCSLLRAVQCVCVCVRGCVRVCAAAWLSGAVHPVSVQQCHLCWLSRLLCCVCSLCLSVCACVLHCSRARHSRWVCAGSRHAVAPLAVQAHAQKSQCLLRDSA